MKYFVYILRTSSNTLYIGQTNNLEKRIKEHRKKTSKSARYVRYFSSFNLVYSEIYLTRKEVMKREMQLKKWTRAKKEALIFGNLKLLKKKKYWSKQVTEKSIALDLDEGVFTWKNPKRIAASLRRSAENSTRKKASPFQSAMSMLNFYINRAGKNLPPERKKVLNQAKIELRRLFGKK